MSRPDPPALAAFKVAPESRALAPFRKRLRPLVRAAGFDRRRTHDIILSVQEVLANVIHHGHRNRTDRDASSKIHVSLRNFSDRIEIMIEDKNPSFDIRKVPAPILPRRKPGGLGVHLIRRLTDQIHYQRLRPRGNRLCLVKYKGGKKGKQD